MFKRFVENLVVKARIPTPPFHLKHWKWLRLSILVGLDVIILAVSFWLAFYLRFDDPKFGGYLPLFSRLIFVVVPVGIAFHFWTGLYRQVWRYANFNSGLIILRSITLGALFSLAAAYMMQQAIPRSIPIIYTLVASLLTAAMRFFWRSWSTMRLKALSASKDTCLIYGAGSGGDLLIRHISANPKFPFQMVGFIDDDPNKKNRLIHGFRILGSLDNLEEIHRKRKIGVVILAIPSATGKVVRATFARCEPLGIKVLIMPDMAEALGEDAFKPRNVDVKDLLKRSPNAIDKEIIREEFSGKRVLVTGAGGSIGSEISRQIATFGPSQIVLLDSSEFALYQIELELSETKRDIPLKIVPILGSMTDESLMKTLFARYRPQIILHAAAYKHVPLVEANPIQGIQNNVIGTKVLVENAIKSGSEKFVLISSDKAVRPTSVMGATKRCCELIVQTHQGDSKTNFCAVRFGNVLGSSGSVVPRFMTQIQKGGPITVTHPEVTRYFMLTNEAVGLVLQATSMSKGGEIFVLDMGEPVMISEMAQQLIRLSGKDIEIIYTGLRPGEKLYEELILEGSEERTLHDNIFVTVPSCDNQSVRAQIDLLINYAKNYDEANSLTLLRNLTNSLLVDEDLEEDTPSREVTVH